jgi:pyruvate,water dikinase
MTTTEATAAQSNRDFPVQWGDADDEELFWFQDVMHNPLPITPLNATLFQPAFSAGASRRMDQLSMPISAIRSSIQNGYVYLGMVPLRGEPAELEARFAEMQRITMELAPTVLQDWRETFEPQVLEGAGRILSFDYEHASAAEIARFARTFYDELVTVWDIHMRVNIPPMNAVFGLEEMLHATLGEEAVTQSRLLLQGFDNKSIETARAMWDLSRWIRSDAALTEAVLAARVRGGEVTLGDGPQAAEFQKRFRAFLDTYGWRSDQFFEIGHKSWHEDPSTPLTILKGYVGRDDSHDPFVAHRRQAAERDRLVGDLAARLPAELQPQFHGMLHMAQQYVPIAEDHNFTIDQNFTAVVRHGILWLGRKLVAEGRLADAEDVFYLTYPEILAVADGADAADLAANARQRRQALGRQARMTAPITLGTPPPADAPPNPLITKFFGVGMPPSGDPNVVTGHPCSAGTVTGEAKVVLTLEEAGKVNPGDILVCRMTMPAWTPLFGVVAAVVADSGGPLSHCAIVAREYEIPCVAGTANGTAVIKDGMQVRVDGSTGIVTILGKQRRG